MKGEKERLRERLREYKEEQYGDAEAEVPVAATMHMGRNSEGEKVHWGVMAFIAYVVVLLIFGFVV